MNYKMPALLAAGAAILSYEENNRLTVSEYRLTFPNLPKAFDGFTIVQLSDLHNKLFGPSQRRILKKIQTLEPDVICMTGDLIDRRRTRVTTMEHGLALIRGCLAMAPVCFVPGNHEAGWRLYPALKTCLSAMGTEVLENRCFPMHRGEDTLWLAGVPDPKFFGEKRKIGFCAQMMETVDTAKGGFTVLLSHRPERLEEYGISGADLVLAGHDHGGQFRLPFAGPVFVPNQGFFPPLAQGVHRAGKTVMVVSRGLGNSVFPQRLLNCPEIVRIVLQSGRKM